MTPCGICSGPLVLRFAGSSGEVGAEDLSPTLHVPGAHSDLYACERCGTIQQPGLPEGDELHDLYRAMRDDAYLDQEAGRRATARRLLDLVEGQATGRGTLLDVGCGHGLLLDEARRRGWSVRGLELAAAARAHATDVLGLEVADATLETLDPAYDGGLDAIVLADVIEHLDDPVGAVRAVAALLRPDGVLCVVTPDPSSRTARLAGERWWGYLPAHTFLLPRSTLRGILAAEGLEPVGADVDLRRSFTLSYWIEGLAGRTAALGALTALAERLGGRGPLRRQVTLSLGDERVVLARR